MLTLLLVVFVQNYLKARAKVVSFFNIAKKNASKHVAKHIFETFLTIQLLKKDFLNRVNGIYRILFIELHAGRS